MRRAFTLIEIIIYLAIVGMVAVTLVMYSVSVATSRGKAEVVAEVQANARLALDTMRQKIHAADTILFFPSILNVDPGQLVLAMPAPLPSPVIFSLDADDGRLRMKVGANPEEFLTSDEVQVTNLRFVDLTDPQGPREHVRIFMTLRYKKADSVDYQYEYSVESAMGVRF